MELEEQGAELIVWSEAAFTKGYIMPEERNLRERLVPRIHTPMLVGALTRRVTEVCAYEDGEVECQPARRTYNSAFILDEEGNVEGTYDKTFLLAFGEYIPFGDLFPQLYEASPNSGRMNSGARIDPLPFPFAGRDWNLSILICYEDILPGFTRDLVRHGSSDLLVNMTNDAWFGDSNEPWIHMDLAKFRAVEHRRYLIRATNTGVSAVIDPVGRLVAHSAVFEQDNINTTVRLLRGGTTVYAFVGDVLGYLALALLAFGLWRTRKTWLRAPAQEGRKGITQSATILLVVAIIDAVFLVLTAFARPAGWEMGGVSFLLWLGTVVALVLSFVLLRRGVPHGLTLAWIGSAARLVLTVLLVLVFLEVGQPSVAAALGIPLLFVFLASANLWFWRARCPIVEAPSKEKKKARRKRKK